MIETDRRTFASYMEDALYGADGYYATGRAASGRAGDYFTAPDVGPIFGQCLTAIFSKWQEKLSVEPIDFIECGAGEGALAESVLKNLPADRFRYTAVERSPFRRKTLEARGGAALRVVPDLEGFSRAPVTGIIFANELIDAFPVHRVRMQKGILQEAFVQGRGAEAVLTWDQPSTPQLAAYLDRLQLALPESYETEINLGMRDWIRQAAACLQSGLIVLIDYGRPAHELFAPERDRGTLRAFHDHHVSNDFLAEPGQRDLTSDVDFTSLAMEAREAGLVPLAFMELGSFLLQGAATRPWSEKDQRGLRYLIHPEGMGSAFHTLILGKGLDADAWVFEHSRLRRLGVS